MMVLQSSLFKYKCHYLKSWEFFNVSFSLVWDIADMFCETIKADEDMKLTASPAGFRQWQDIQKDVVFAAGQKPQAPKLSAVRYDLVWKLPGEGKLFISMERSVGGWFGVLRAHSAVVWATNCTSRKTLCNHPAIVYSRGVTTATGFRDRAEEPVLVGGRKECGRSFWVAVNTVFVHRYEFPFKLHITNNATQTLLILVH